MAETSNSNEPAPVADSNDSTNLTVTQVAENTGGIAPGNLVETDIDDELFRFSSDDTPPHEPDA